MILKAFPPNVRFDGCSLITGFHGIGATGYWTVKHLIHMLTPKREVIFDSDLISPISSTFNGRLVTPYEVFRKDLLAILKVEAPPYKDSEVEFFRAIGEWVIQSGFKEVALVGGLDSSLRYDNSTYRIAYTSKYTPKNDLVNAKVLEDDHIIVGPVAILLNYFEARDFPAFAILAYASTERMDPRATAEAVKVLSGYYGFEADVSTLLKGAEIIESELQKTQTKVIKPG
ncbi:MAG: proteasome assembly chaperone family protein, partial [Nitrososphaerales archaeon]